MRWFKHLSGSLKDSFIFELIEEFGGDGYLVFFGVLEIMSDEFDVFNPGLNKISIKKLQNTFQLSRQRTLKILRRINQKSLENLRKSDKNLADFCEKTDKMNVIHQKFLRKKSQKLAGFLCHINKTDVEVICIKLKDLCDEYTSKELRKMSGVDPESLRIKSGQTPDQELELKQKLELELLKGNNIIYNILGGDLKNTGIDELARLPIEKINALLAEFSKALLMEKIFPGVEEFIRKMKKENKNVRAILHSIIRCYERRKFSKSPESYCSKIIQIENPNYNARLAELESEKIKNEENDFLKKNKKALNLQIPGDRK